KGAPFLPSPWSPPEDFVEILDTRMQHVIGLARCDLIRARHIFEIGEEIGTEDSPDEPHRKRQIDFQPTPMGRCLIELVLCHKEDSKILEAKSLQRHSVGLMVLSEATRTTGPGSKIHIFFDDVILPMLLYFVSQEAHQVAGCKGRWTAGS